MSMQTTINSISQQITKISKLLEEEQEFNQKYFHKAIHNSHRDSGSE